MDMGALVTLDLPDDSPMLALPWIITFGPLSDEEAWDAVVCGPYERGHALALAEAVLADEDEVTAVVEPLLPHATVDEIRSEIETAKVAAEEEYDEEDEDEGEHDGLDIAVDSSYDEASGYADDDDEEEEYDVIEPGPPPAPEEIRAGFARIAARLTAGV
jgi:hypothetical protein